MIFIVDADRRSLFTTVPAESHGRGRTLFVGRAGSWPTVPTLMWGSDMKRDRGGRAQAPGPLADCAVAGRPRWHSRSRRRHDA